MLSFFGGIDITPLSESPNDLLLCFLGLEVGKRLIKVQDQIKLWRNVIKIIYYIKLIYVNIIRIINSYSTIIFIMCYIIRLKNNF